MHLPFKLSVLAFIQNDDGRHLLIRRAKAPNLGAWSPIGGKIEMSAGESPHACVVRETLEEVGWQLTTDDFHLFGMITERGYEGSGHWLMFLFRCLRPIAKLPPDIEEGCFGFFSRSEMDQLNMPETDRQVLWTVFDQHAHDFVALSADCHPGQPLKVVTEGVLRAGSSPVS